jgi:hypothetical protein
MTASYSATSGVRSPELAAGPLPQLRGAGCHGLRRGPAPAALRSRLEPLSGGLTAKAASCCRRCLSPRPGAGRGDHVPGLSTTAAAAVTALPARGAAPRGHRRLPRPKPPLPQEARVPRRPQGGRVPLPNEPVARAKLRGPRSARVAGPDERPYPRPRPAPHHSLRHYANRTRGARRNDEPECPEASAEPTRRRCSPTWARLIARIYQTDPLVCTRCGQRMQTTAFLTDQLSIRRILDHLGLSPPEQAPPRP